MLPSFLHVFPGNFIDDVISEQTASFSLAWDDLGGNSPHLGTGVDQAIILLLSRKRNNCLYVKCDDSSNGLVFFVGRSLAITR